MSLQFSKLILLGSFLVGMLLLLAVTGNAQPVPRGEAIFMGVLKSDRVGPTSAAPDGRPDAAFSLTLKPRPSEPMIAEIQIRPLSGSPGFWSSTGQTSGAGYLGLPEPRLLHRLLTPKGAY